MSTTAILAQSVDHVTALAHQGAVLAETIQIPTQEPPVSGGFLKMGGAARWIATFVGVAMLIVGGGVMAVEKFTDHSVGSKGGKIILWSLVGGIVIAGGTNLYAWVQA